MGTLELRSSRYSEHARGWAAKVLLLFGDVDCSDRGMELRIGSCISGSREVRCSAGGVCRGPQHV